VIPESSPPACPTCQGELAKRPERKSRCPHCGAAIYVRSVPDGGRVLLKEADLPALEARRTKHASTPRPRARWDYVPVVGESHRNQDGSDRQQIIRERARPGDPVQLVPEPDNRHDRRAVKVCLATGEQLGYLDRDQARELARERREGWRHAAILHRVIGGTADKPTRGVVLRLVSGPPGIPDSDFAVVVEEARSAPDRWDREPDTREGPRVGIELSFSVPFQGGEARAPVEPTRDTEPSRRVPILLAVVALIALGLAGAAWLLFVR